jgi:hypothetical protein
MKVYICIPSLNESKNIGLITKIIDQGLQDLSSSYNGLIEGKIINIDSSSEDNTVDVFNRVDTFFPKESIILEQPRGKGKNLLYFIKLAYIEKVDYCLTIDADVSSVDPSWIKDLLTPILNKEADFVTPLYERSRFEGSTTNHFAYPLVLAFTGIEVRQPIAGDFAFNFSLVDLIYNLNTSESVNNYGIDIFLVLSALSNGLKHKEVKLGKKIHNPSFDKLEYMFPQVASATLSLLQNMTVKKNNIFQTKILLNNISSLSSFPHKEAAEKMRDNSFLYLKSVNLREWNWVPLDYIEKFEKENNKKIQMKDWVVLLYEWVNYSLKNKNINTDFLAKQLLPFFVVRATTFWFFSEKATAGETENQIKNQALLLQNYFNK